MVRTYFAAPITPMAYLCGETDGHPVQRCHEHRRAANHHEERYEDRPLKGEFDYQVPIVQGVVYDVQCVIGDGRILVEVLINQLGINDALCSRVQLEVADGQSHRSWIT